MYCYPAMFLPNPLHPGRYDVAFADLPGCISAGDTLPEALRMAQEALTAHLALMLEDGDALPTPSTLDAARQADLTEAKQLREPLPEETFWQYVVADPQTASTSSSVEAVTARRAAHYRAV